MSKGHDEKAQQEHGGSKDRDDVGSSRKGRGLLNVPSRGSSQPVQSSSAATGLSGATANEPRDSIGGHSKESKSSRLGRRRNGSVSSNRSGAGTVPTPSTSHPNSAAGAPQRRKKGGLLALLGCCGVPDNANALDGGEDPVPSHKLDRIPQRPLTSSRRTITPSEQTTASKTQLQEKEKEAQPQAPPPTSPPQEISKSTQPISTSTYDQPTVADRPLEAKQTTAAAAPGPSITVNPPATEKRQREQAVETTPSQDVDGDVSMPDADAAAAASQLPQEPANTADEQVAKPMPPPPPGPIPIAGAAPISQTETSIASEDSEPQKFLLPPIEPHLKGRKCLVLDLDETLVHSSFKVSLRNPSDL